MDITAADIAALREVDGDLAEFIRSLTDRPTQKAAPPPVLGGIHGPLHRPGAWPAGTRPADSSTCHPDCDCALTKPAQPAPIPPAA